MPPAYGDGSPFLDHVPRPTVATFCGSLRSESNLERDSEQDHSAALSAFAYGGVRLRPRALDLARIEAGRMDLAPSEVHLPSLVQGVVDVGQVRAEQREIAFQLLGAGSAPPRVRRASL